MKKNKKFFFIFFILLSLVLIYLNFFNKNDIKKADFQENIDESYNSNIIKNVNYQSKDANGNEYIIDAIEGEIDTSNSNVIFLTNVTALIKMNNYEIGGLNNESAMSCIHRGLQLPSSSPK